MSRPFSLACLVLFGVSVGCGFLDPGIPGSGVAATEERELGPFQSIQFDGAGSLEVRIGEPGPLVLTADENLLPILETTITDGRLTIAPRKSIQPETSIMVKISVADLRAITLNGAARATLFDIDSQQLAIELNGACELKATGIVERLDVRVSGASDLELAGLRAQEVVIELNGACSAEVHAEELLDATLNGLGSLRYAGSPEVRQTVNGLGSISGL